VDLLAAEQGPSIPASLFTTHEGHLPEHILKQAATSILEHHAYNEQSLVSYVAEFFSVIPADHRRTLVVVATAAAKYAAEIHYLSEAYQRSPDTGKLETAGDACKSFAAWNFGLRHSNGASLCSRRVAYFAVYSLVKFYVIIFFYILFRGGVGRRYCNSERPATSLNAVVKLRCMQCRRDEVKVKKNHDDEAWFENFSKAMNLSVAYAANIGGSATLTGTGPNLVVKGQLDTLVHAINQSINFISFYHVVLVDGLPMFQANLANAAFFSSG